MQEISKATIETLYFVSSELQRLEAAKVATTADYVARVHAGGPSKRDPLAQGAMLDYTIPAADLRAELSRRIDAIHTQTAALGFRLVP